MSKTVISQAHYVGLTMELFKQEKRRGSFVMRMSRGEYVVRLRYLSVKDDETWYYNIMREKAKSVDRTAHDVCTLEVMERDWSYESIVEASAHYEALRNKVRNLGIFRNLNKGKIPDYRDKPV